MMSEKYFLGDRTINGELDICRNIGNGRYVVIATIKERDAKTIVRELNENCN